MSVLKLFPVTVRPLQPIIRLRHAHYLGVFGVTVLGLVLRFFMIGHQSLWIDEGYSLLFSDGQTFQEVLNRLLETNMSDRFRVLFYFALFGWRKLLGDSEVAVRSLPALFGFLSILLTYFTARYCFDKQRSLWSFLLISTSAYCVFYSQELRDYSMLMCLAAAQLFCLSRALYPPKRGLWLFRWLFAILIAVGLFANILTVYFTAALAVAHALTTRRLKMWLSWWLPAAGLSVLPTLFYVSASTSSAPETVITGRLKASIIHHFGYAIYGFVSGLTYGPPPVYLRVGERLQMLLQYWPFMLILLVVILTLGGMLIALITHRWGASAPSIADQFLLYTVLLTCVFGALFVYLTEMDWLPRHLCYLWPPFALVLPALVVDRFSRSLPPWKSQLAHACLVLLLVVNGISLYNYYFNEQYYKDDFRAAAAYTLQTRQPNVKSVLIGGAGDTYLLKHYGDRLTLDGHRVYKKPEITVSERFDMADELDELTDGADQVMLLVNREYLYGPPGTLQQEMSSLYQLDETVTFKYFQIYHFQRLS